MKKLNIYFDINGVLLETKSPKKDIIKLLKHCLRKYPNSTYWLTTHCRSGENKTNFVLKGEFPDKLVDQIYNTFLPTDWEVFKTEAIDLDNDFVWFDDNLFEGERNILEKYLALDGFFKMNPKDSKMAKKALRFLKKQG